MRIYCRGVKDKEWTQLSIPTSMFERIEALLKRKYKGDYGKTGVPEFIREAVRNRLLELGAYDDDIDDEELSSNED